MTTAGDLDRKITLERRGDGEDGWGTPVPGAGPFEPFATVWASRTDISDTEKYIAGRTAALLTSRFVVRSSTLSRTFLPSDRIALEGGHWDIDGIKETRDGRRRFLEITATRGT